MTAAPPPTREKPMDQHQPYLVGLTADCRYREGGETLWGNLHLERLDEAGLSWRLLPDVPHLSATELEGLDAVISFGHAPFSVDLVRALPKLRHVARYGAGYDGIDVEGLAGEGVVVTTTPGPVRRPLALTALTLLLASAHRLVENHRVTVEGRWHTDRGNHRGLGLPGRTVGIVGFGSVGSMLAELILRLGVDVTVICNDRRPDNPSANALGVECVDLPTLAGRADFVVSTAALTPQSRHMFDELFFAAMKSTAYFINVGRGGLVDQPALTAAIAGGGIAGAALDVFEPEPPEPSDPLLGLDSVIATPHALSWTNDFTAGVATSMVEAVIAAAGGEVPSTTLRPDLLDAEGWAARTA